MNNLDQFIKNKRKNKSLLLMMHVVYGYPTVDKSLDFIRTILDSGVELLEVQFPFSDPIADGPIITSACHKALQNRLQLSECIEQLTRLSETYPETKMLLMSYINPLFQFGIENLAKLLFENFLGVIVPDVPIEHAQMLEPFNKNNVAVIRFITHDAMENRIKFITEKSEGMIYCISNSGVTGQTQINIQNIQSHLLKIKSLTNVPLAVGFGISNKNDVTHLQGYADVAIVGSALIRAFNADNLNGVKNKIKELQQGI